MRRLRRVFNRAHERDLFTLDDLVNEVKAERKESVAFLLSQLASNEIIDEVIRVDSPRGGGIREYKSINEIESPLFDPYQREDIDVEPKLIKVFFRKRSSADKSAAVSAHRDHAHA